MASPNHIIILDNKIEVRLDVIYKIEGNAIVSYAPALDLSGCGKDEEEARKSLKIVLNNYIKFTIKNSTLEADLAKHNWKKHVNKQHEIFEGPEFPLILMTSDQAKSMTRGAFSKSNVRITVSCS